MFFTDMSKDVKLAEVRALYREGELEKASQTCREFLTDHHDSSLSALYGLILCQTGELQNGRYRLELASKDDRLSAEAMVDIGGGYLFLNEPATACQFLEKAVLLVPHMGIAFSRLAIAQFLIRKFEDALGNAQQSCELLPHDPIVHINLARIFLTMNRCNEALTTVEKVSEMQSPLPMVGMRVWAEILIALGKWQDARQRLTTFLTTFPNYPEFVRLLSFVMAAMDQHEEADYLLRRGLEKHPDDDSLLTQWAQVSLARGFYTEALEALRRRLNKNPDNSTLWVQLCRVSLYRDMEELSRTAAQKALDLTNGQEGPLRGEALWAMATVEAHSGEYRQAELLFQQSILQAPAAIMAKTELGHMYMQLGRIDEAVTLYQEVASTKPLVGQIAMIHARRFPNDLDVLAKIEQAARQPGIEGSVRSGLLFNLAATWDHRGEFDKAFQCASLANGASRKFILYDYKEYREYSNNLIRHFSPSFLARRTSYGTPGRLPVFVLGMPRSGTTLVEQILASHPDVYGAGEVGLFSQLIQHLSSWEFKLGSGRTYPECLNDMTAEESRIFADQLILRLQKMSLHATRIIDKLPHNFENIGLIHLLFPNAAIVHCNREARDIAVSNYFIEYRAKFGGMGFAYDLETIGEQLRDHQNLMDHWHQTLPGRIYEINYEELVEDIEGHARRLLEHIGLPWHGDVLDFQKNSRPVKTASLWQVRQPVYKTSKERWRHYEKYLAPLEKILATPLPKPVPVASTQDDQVTPGLYVQGMSYLERGRAAAAEPCFRELVGYFPNHAAAHHMLGMALFRQQKDEEALAEMQLSIQLHDIHPVWHENIAKILQALGRVTEAEKEIQTAQQQKASFYNPWNDLLRTT